MDMFKLGILREIQALQKIGACRNLDACEHVRDMDLTPFEPLSVTEATNLILMLL